MIQRLTSPLRSLVGTAALFGVVLLLSNCHRSVPEARTATSRKPALASAWADKRRQGIDFVGIGTGPTATTANWQLDIDFSKQIVFRTLNSPDVVMAMPKPQFTGTGMGVLLDATSAPTYASASRRGRSSTAKPNRTKIYIEPNTCRDPLTKRDYAYKVRVESNGKRYVGCGAFIRGSNRLNGAWVLETFKGQRLRPALFANNELPSLDIDLDEQKLTGYTGYNKLKGSIRADADQLAIDPKTTTNKNAPGTFEADLLESLRRASLFRLGKHRLTLLVNGQYVMTWQKKGE